MIGSTIRHASRRSWAIGAFTVALLMTAGCGSNSNSEFGLASPTPGTALPTQSGPNVLPLTVNGGQCATDSYPNKPCVSVTICIPGTSTCETINDILLDSGSFGLRIFKSVVGTNPAIGTVLVPSNTSQLAECVTYGDGSSDWGPVLQATVILGGEAPVTIPIQVIDSAYPSVGVAAQTCGTVDPSTGDRIPPDSDPSTSGFNGILGVGLFAQDCGAPCASSANNGVYFTCTGDACNGSEATLAQQVADPITALSADSNGVVLQLPNVPASGAASASGYLILGIGTASNNSPGTSVTAYPADSTTGQFEASYEGVTYESFIDSGSNGIFFPGDPSEFPDCGSSNPDLSGWFCPSSTQSPVATVMGSNGTPSGSEPFSIGSMLTLSNSGNSTFNDIGGSGALGGAGTQVFDWGIPFFLGRNVYVGFENANSKLASGTYWAF